MQPNGERKVNTQQCSEKQLFDRIQEVAEKNRNIYENAMEDFRNKFTLGETTFDGDYAND